MRNRFVAAEEEPDEEAEEEAEEDAEEEVEDEKGGGGKEKVIAGNQFWR